MVQDQPRSEAKALQMRSVASSYTPMVMQLGAEYKKQAAPTAKATVDAVQEHFPRAGGIRRQPLKFMRYHIIS